MQGQSQRLRMRDAQLANQRAARLRRIVIVGSAVLALVLIAVMVVVLVQQKQTPAASAPSEMAYPPNATAARDGIIINDNKGKPDVGLYFDYQCSHCVQFEQSFGGALTLLGQTGEIRLVHHTRVFLDSGNADGLSHKAALAAACADVVGDYAQFHSAIFEAAPQGPYTDKLLLETIPAQLGMTGTDLTAFRSCNANKSLAPFVQNVEDAAMKAGLTETPLLTVNGKAIPATTFNGKTGDDLKAIIDAAAKG
jgi:protein-disulfide isomerase